MLPFTPVHFLGLRVNISFLGWKRGIARKVGLAGGLFPPFDCYSLVPLLSRPG